jgi:hypothetical protein
MASTSGALAVVCLAAGLLHLIRLAVLRRDVVGEVSYTAMGLGMAAMFSPLGDPVPTAVWCAVFVLAATWFAVRVLRGDAAGGEAAHHVVGSGAMLFMLVAGNSEGALGGHAAHGAGPDSALAGAVGLVSATAMLLAGYFAWHALRCADRCRTTTCPDPHPAVSVQDGRDGRDGPDAAVARRAPAFSVCAPQTAAVSHVVLAVAMTAMLLRML